ncbi:hypothetical protein HYP06_gp080 [Vibrio phage vB_VspP_pVa5]|uniref:Uncharacterized protein n=1 Tax=Vibrio phage vB_VspP_pVa5 TaxID=1913109 RepID=A0A1J0GV73_9CAUD|nr:hypothetical protein HYP06_gp080 [Vibrio phage vB_VspP_pVa5]APC46089.1 hypothetical protein vBVspPpVa5_0093 [Vibrio phage vB_VspP_pVa5]
MNQELMMVLIGIRDFIDLDNKKEITRDGTYIVSGTNFDSGDQVTPSSYEKQYPELNMILNDADHLRVVNQAIEQLKLIELLES